MSSPKSDRHIWVYISGPYTKPDPVENTHKAIKFATRLRKQNIIPFVPHLTLLWHAVTPMPYDFWLRLDFDYLRRMDAVFRLPGESSGADKEVALAEELGIPVFTSTNCFWEWVRGEDLYGR